MTTFIKAEEQNHSLYNYVNMLNTETDALEESNKDIRGQMQRIVERGKMSEQEQTNTKKQMEDECTQLEIDIDKKYIFMV